MNANVYLTPSGAHQAFESHFDWMDGIIVQVIGCKTWIIDSYPTAISPMPDTVFKIHDLNDVNPANSRDKKRRNGRKPSDVQFLGSDSNSTSDPSSTEFDLSEGSLLYIPRGFTHQAATNCSRRTFDSTGGSTANTAGFGDVASIHVTFGLEAVTDSTVEIFLHHYISLFFDIQEDRCDVLDDENSSSRFTHTDGLLDSSDARCRARVPPQNVTNSTSALPLLKISLLNQRDNSTFHIEDMSKNDLAHLILHSAATSDSRLDAGSSETAVHLNAGDNRTKGKQQIYRMDPSVLRQAVATTTFIARNGYQPMIGDLLPLSLKYLSHYLTKHTATEVIYHAILLGIEMHLLKAKRTGHNSRDNYEPKGGERASGEFKDPESSKKLNYITRFMTSDPVVSHESRIAQAESDGKAERSDRQGDKGINELRLLLISGEWMIVPGSSESAESAEEFFMAVFSGLAEEDEADIVEMESGSGSRNADNTEDLFCPSWRRMTDALRASTADGP